MIADSMMTYLERGSLIRQMFERGNMLKTERGEEKVFDFSLGNPCLSPPQKLLDNIRHYLTEDGVHAYMPNAGHVRTREAIASSYNKRFDTAVTADNVLMTCGAAAALSVFFRTILNPGDEVLVFSPYFSEYEPYINLAGGVLVTIDTTENFRPRPEALKDAITDRTKVLLTNSPNNPTGVVYTKEEYFAIAEILRAAQQTIYWISDEPYREIVSPDAPEHTSILTCYRHSVIAYSYSKSASLAGERIGYLLWNPKIEDGIHLAPALANANRIMGFVNAPSLFQLALADDPNCISDVDYYVENGKCIQEILRSIGFSFIKPEGGFYLFLKCPTKDDLQFCELAARYGILLVPSSAFGIKGYARVSYCVKREVITRSAKAFIALFHHLEREDVYGRTND